MFETRKSFEALKLTITKDPELLVISLKTDPVMNCQINKIEIILITILDH